MSIITVGDTEVEYEQTGSGPDLLLVHSLLTEMTVFDSMLLALVGNAPNGHRVTRLNLPGFGNSAPVVCEGLAAHADHLARAIKALHLPETTAVFGNGFGSFVVLQLAIRNPHMFGKLLVADTGAMFPEAGRAPFRGMLWDGDRIKGARHGCQGSRADDWHPPSLSCSRLRSRLLACGSRGWDRSRPVLHGGEWPDHAHRRRDAARRDGTDDFDGERHRHWVNLSRRRAQVRQQRHFRLGALRAQR